MPTTLTIDGLPEGDEPNTVVVKYTKPVEDQGAWETATFTAIDEYVDNATESVKKTQLDLPGVYRTSEASNKAIQKLLRSNNRLRVSFVSSDEGIIFQPGDMITVTDTSRGVDIDVWVESNVMVSYGRYRITGIVYSDRHFTDECYVEEDEQGSWLDVLGPPVITIDCIQYGCDKFETAANAVGVNSYWPFDLGDSSNLTDQVGSVDLTDNTPVGAPNYIYPSLLDNCTGYSTYIADETGSEWLIASTHPYNGPNITIGGVFKKIKGGTVEMIEVNSLNTAANYIQLRFDGSNITVNVRTSTVPYTGAVDESVTTAASPNAQGVIGAAVTLSYNAGSDETTIRLYNNFTSGSPEAVVMSGRFGAGVSNSSYPLYIAKNGGVAFEKVFVASSALSTSSMSALAEALDQNFVDYVDPNCA